MLVIWTRRWIWLYGLMLWCRGGEIEQVEEKWEDQGIGWVVLGVQSIDIWEHDKT